MFKKLLLTAITGTAFACTIHAQQIAQPHLAYNQKPTTKSIFAQNLSNDNLLVLNEEKYHKFRKMRNAGIVLTSAGAALITGGVILISDGAREGDYYYEDGYYTSDDGKIVGGAVCIVTGVLSLGGGITMWAIGSNKMKKYGSTISLQPTRNGGGLVYRF